MIFLVNFLVLGFIILMIFFLSLLRFLFVRVDILRGLSFLDLINFLIVFIFFLLVMLVLLRMMMNGNFLNFEYIFLNRCICFFIGKLQYLFGLKMQMIMFLRCFKVRIVCFLILFFLFRGLLSSFGVFIIWYLRQCFLNWLMFIFLVVNGQFVIFGFVFVSVFKRVFLLMLGWLVIIIVGSLRLIMGSFFRMFFVLLRYLRLLLMFLSMFVILLQNCFLSLVILIGFFLQCIFFMYFCFRFFIVFMVQLIFVSEWWNWLWLIRVLMSFWQNFGRVDILGVLLSVFLRLFFIMLEMVLIFSFFF